MNVRPAAVADLETLVEMGARMHAEGAYAFLPYDPARVRRVVTRYIEAGGVDRCFLVAERGAEIVGFLAGYLETYFFCTERVASDVLFFVDRPRRGSRAALLLVEAFRKWAVERGAREVCLGITSGVATEKIERFYEKLGFSRAGSIYKQRP